MSHDTALRPVRSFLVLSVDIGTSYGFIRALERQHFGEGYNQVGLENRNILEPEFLAYLIPRSVGIHVINGLGNNKDKWRIMRWKGDCPSVGI